MLVEEDRLIEKLRAIERLFAGAQTEGERVAAENARGRICRRLAELAKEEKPIEYRFSLADMWSRRLFVALLRRYGITPYRYQRQRYTTVMARVPQRFVDETLCPEFEKLDRTLRTYLDEVTTRVIAESIYEDNSEAEVRNDGPPALPKNG